MKNPPIAHGAMNIANSLPENRLTRYVPLTAATGRQMPSTPDTSPRCAIGTWSGSTAIWAASSALKNSWAMHHPRRTTATFGANATMRMPSEPPTRPMTIHGRRMPSRDDVRSLSLPKKGLPTMATTAPIPATSAKRPGASSSPTSELIFSASVTSRGAMNSSDVLMTANAYSAMNRHPTGCIVADPDCRAGAGVPSTGRRMAVRRHSWSSSIVRPASRAPSPTSNSSS